MKKILATLALAATVVLQSFAPQNNSDEKEVSITKSSITWKGYKVTGSHTGIIALKSGSLSFEDSKLVGGTFVMDMNSIACTDLEGVYKGKLEGHLKSDDFFGVENNPTARLVFNNVTAGDKDVYTIKGELTIKGKTNSVLFDLTVNEHNATTALKINRAKYDVKYGSTSFFEGLKDKAIYDEFDLQVNLEF
ncbi:YceI family protein [Flavicella sp.]|nr:YceI family protein [Flavicella sp.]MDA9111663.1 YceI family protein [Flavicella sp.]